MKNPSSPKSQTCVIYTRVSTEEQRETGYSLDAQSKALREYARSHNYKVVAEFVDAESGAKAGRKQFAKMLQLIEKESIGAIVVEKTDRLYRNTHDAVKVDNLGVHIHFVKESKIITPQSNSSDTFMHDIMIAQAKFFSRRLKEEVVKGMREKALQGVFPTYAPIGYLNVQNGPRKGIAPDPERAPLVKALFEAYASGHVIQDGTAEFAKSIGLTSRAGKFLPRSTLDRMLDNPAYVGIVSWSGIVTAGEHEPLITRELWEEVQAKKHARNTRAGASRKPFVYIGLIKCSHCGAAITAELHKQRYVYYHCTGTRNTNCPGKKYVKEEAIDAQFVDLLSTMALSEKQIEYVKQGLEIALKATRESTENNLEALQREEKKLRNALERLYLDRIKGDVPESVYPTMRERLEAQLAEISVHVRAYGPAERDFYAQGISIIELAKTAGVRFKHANSAQKRVLLLELLSNCNMRDGTIAVQLQNPFDSILGVQDSHTENRESVLSGRADETHLELIVTAIHNYLLAA